jgi:hypothetical protein
MGKLGYRVIPGQRDEPAAYLEMRPGFLLRADLFASEDVVAFDLDAPEFETERQIFIRSTVRNSATEPPPY